MYSINYMHEGEGKIWYAIPDYHREKFEKLAKDKLAYLFNEDPNLLHNINVMINPAYLVENGVHVYRTIQKPGEIVLTFPESYHQGVSVGFNIAEAVNMACPSWLDYTNKAMNIYMATREKVPVFPVNWMLIENARFIHKSIFDKENLVKLKEYYQRFVEKELMERSLIASNFPDKETYATRNLRMLVDRDNISEEENECFYCINLCYASFVK
jgi:[histone H3]-trimethyl-L-lysine4 demethylase